ncbi:sensor histidine kinase [Terrabacter sp. 2RAF25]|uniref:sensor histidine kinase n=1 Tax=Terrabacter sp. 2RAF25 TaxID=3232998 RepID=UPI003F9E54A8
MTLFRSRSGVRRQATVAAAAVVAVALLLGGALLVLVLQRALTQTLQDSIVAIVDEDASVFASTGPAGLERSERDEGPDNVLVQVISTQGTAARVLYTSRASRPDAVTDLRPAVGETRFSGASLLPMPLGRQEPLVVARGVDNAGTPYVLVAAASQASRAEAVLTTAALLGGALPMLVALTALVTWWRVGRALGSVDAIRLQVERTTAAHLHDRVPVPATDDEIAHLAETMNSMLARLDSSQRAQRRFVADASHELRSPLATIRTSFEVVDPSVPETSWEQLGPIVRSEAERMGRLVDNLLLLSRADDASLTAVRVEVDLDEVVDAEARRLRQLGGVTVRLENAPMRVLGDELQLQQVVRNLLDNAATHARSRVHVTVSTDGRRALVTVDDDGVGIPARDRERVFERFVRLDASRSRDSGGTGLGLSIARELAVAHGGTLLVSESPLGGARFELSLPLPPTGTADRP